MRWAIMGTGGIAAAFAEAIMAEGHEVVAVGSGDADRAAKFAHQHHIERSYGEHHLVLEDDVDAVYVATTNDRHHLDARACIDAGIPALVEKPFALDLPKAESVVAAAQANGVFLMEAMWMRLQPGFLEIERRIADGQIGEPRMVIADFGIAADPDPLRRWFSPAHGGGALFDVGVYPLTLAIAVLGEPLEASALGETAETGVDAQVAVAMRHARGLSSWSCSFVADTGIEATIAGSEGNLRLQGPFQASARVRLQRRGQASEDIEVAGADLGYRYEVREVARCLEQGATSSEVVTLEDTLAVQRWLDELRRQVATAPAAP